MESVGGREGTFTTCIPEDADPASPVVVLLGWAGAEDRQLAKFAELYAARGLISIRAVQPLSKIFAVRESPRIEWARWLLEHLCDPSGPAASRDLIFHGFSNGGLYALRHLVELVDAAAAAEEAAARAAGTKAVSGGPPSGDPSGGGAGVATPSAPTTRASVAGVRDRTRGWIFDSAPVFPSSRELVEVATAVSTSTAQRLAIIASNMLSAQIFPTRTGQFWSCMRTLGWGKPQLLLFSLADEITRADKLEELVEEKRALGQEVHTRIWPDSKHVLHFKNHPREYTAAIDALLSRCGAASAPRSRI